MASSVPYKQKRGLIIAVNAYPKSEPKYCINDAQDLCEALSDIGCLVTQATENCKLSELFSSVDRFTETIEAGDLAIFYFYGHGKQNKGETYLFPSGYAFGGPGLEDGYIKNNAIRFGYVMEKISGKKPYASICVFDCCRENIETRGKSKDTGFSVMEGPKQTLIVFACGPGEYALDQTKNGRNEIFMEKLLIHKKFEQRY